MTSDFAPEVAKYPINPVFKVAACCKGAQGEAPKTPRSRHRYGVEGGGEWIGGILLPIRLGGLGERRELPQRGPGRSPGRK